MGNVVVILSGAIVALFFALLVPYSVGFFSLALLRRWRLLLPAAAIVGLALAIVVAIWLPTATEIEPKLTLAVIQARLPLGAAVLAAAGAVSGFVASAVMMEGVGRRAHVVLPTTFILGFISFFVVT